MCYRPIYLKKNETYVPCNKCPKCIRKRVAQWSFRLQEEEKVCSSANFITLTYDTSHVPVNDAGKMVLHKPDLQLFFKRLRKKQSGNGVSGIKYYAVGEYGGRTKRPHYHIILFNADVELVQSAWSCEDQNGVWSNIGHIYNGSVSGASIGYTLKYMTKNKKQDAYVKKGMQPEFAVMSKGLGISYLDNESMVNWHIADMVNRMYCSAPGGIKMAMPRYYKERLYLENEKSLIAEVHQKKIHEFQLEKLLKQSFKDVRNEQIAIDHEFDRMYASSLKTTL